MQIKKVKVVKETLEVSFTERKEDGTVKTVTEVHETKPHPDLLQALKNLRIHFALLTGYLGIKAVKKIETPADDLIESFTVSGFSVKTGDDEGVVITGRKTLENGKTVILNTPFTRFGEGDESAYKFTDDLIEKVERANTEVNAYLHDGKKADDPQQTLGFPEGSNAAGTVTDLQEDDDKVWKDGKRPELASV